MSNGERKRKGGTAARVRKRVIGHGKKEAREGEKERVRKRVIGHDKRECERERQSNGEMEKERERMTGEF